MSACDRADISTPSRDAVIDYESLFQSALLMLRVQEREHPKRPRFDESALPARAPNEDDASFYARRVAVLRQHVEGAGA